MCNGYRGLRGRKAQAARRAAADEAARRARWAEAARQRALIHLFPATAPAAHGAQGRALAGAWDEMDAAAGPSAPSHGATRAAEAQGAAAAATGQATARPAWASEVVAGARRGDPPRHTAGSHACGLDGTGDDLRYNDNDEDTAGGGDDDGIYGDKADDAFDGYYCEALGSREYVY